MDSTASSFTARNNTKRAAEKMIANGKASAARLAFLRNVKLEAVVSIVFSC